MNRPWRLPVILNQRHVVRRIIAVRDGSDVPIRVVTITGQDGSRSILDVLESVRSIIAVGVTDRCPIQPRSRLRQPVTDIIITVTDGAGSIRHRLHLVEQIVAKRQRPQQRPFSIPPLGIPVAVQVVVILKPFAQAIRPVLDQFHPVGPVVTETSAHPIAVGDRFHQPVRLPADPISLQLIGIG